LIYQKGDKAMERLTDRFDDGTIGVFRIFDRSDLIDINDLVTDEITSASIAQAAEKLFDYEDTGLTPEEISNLVTINGNLVRTNEKLNYKLSSYRDAEEQGLLIKRDCTGCTSDDCYECVRCGKYEDRYKPEEALKGDVSE
jgi:hypothetical protein